MLYSPKCSCRAMSQWSAPLIQCFYLFWMAPCCRQTCGAWLTSILRSRAMSQIHSVPMSCPPKSMLLPILSGSLLSADLQRLSNKRVAEPRHVPDTLCGSPLSADMQHLTKRVAESCHVPDTLRPNDLPSLVNALTYSEWLPVVGRLAALIWQAGCRAAPCPRYTLWLPVVGRHAALDRRACCRVVPCPRCTPSQWFAPVSQCFYLFWVAPCGRQTCRAWLTRVLQSRAMSQIHSVAPCCWQTCSAWLTRCCRVAPCPDTVRPNDLPP